LLTFHEQIPYSIKCRSKWSRRGDPKQCRLHINCYKEVLTTILCRLVASNLNYNENQSDASVSSHHGYRDVYPPMCMSWIRIIRFSFCATVRRDVAESFWIAWSRFGYKKLKSFHHMCECMYVCTVQYSVHTYIQYNSRPGNTRSWLMEVSTRWTKKIQLDFILSFRSCDSRRDEFVDFPFLYPPYLFGGAYMWVSILRELYSRLKYQTKHISEKVCTVFIYAFDDKSS
jgi:hypothetical protein